MNHAQPLAFSPEPWHATKNGTIYCSEGPIGDMEDPNKPDPSYASERDVANAARAVACVNALATINRPEALPEVLAAARALRGPLRILLREGLESRSSEAVVSALARLEDSLTQLDRPIEP